MIAGSGTTRGSTIFVVDDDPSMRVALERLFRSVGWPVRTFASAEEFLREDLHHVRGCLIADVHLGTMTGFELQAALRHRADDLPVILTSGVDDTDMEAEARRLAVLGFFRKPFDVSALLDLVQRGLNSVAAV